MCVSNFVGAAKMRSGRRRKFHFRLEDGDNMAFEIISTHPSCYSRLSAKTTKVVILHMHMKTPVSVGSFKWTFDIPFLWFSSGLLCQYVDVNLKYFTTLSS